jgi:hypothetical protein
MKGRFFFAALCLLLAVYPTTTATVIERTSSQSKVEVLDKTAPGGDVVGSAPSKSHPIYVVADQSMAAEMLEKKIPEGVLVAVNAAELIGFSDVVHKARIFPEAEPLVDGADPTVQVSHDNTVPRAFQGTVPSKRSLQVLKGTATTTTKRSMQVLKGTVERSLLDVKSPYKCTFIASYRSDEAVDTVCQLTTNLLEDGEKDVSVIDVGGNCKSTSIKQCPPRRRLNIHAPFGSTKRSLQSIDTPPPTSSPAPGYIVFSANGYEFTCDQIANKLNDTPGVLSVTVDTGGTIELSTVSDIAVLCHL